MSKKTRPVLYEVLRRRSENRTQWRSPRPRAIESDAPAESIEATPSHVSRPPAQQRPDFLRLLGNRIEFSISGVMLGGAGVGLLVLLVVAFQIGRYTAGSAAKSGAGSGEGDTGITNLLNSVSQGNARNDQPVKLREPERPTTNVPRNSVEPDGGSIAAKPRDNAKSSPPAEPDRTGSPPPPGDEPKPVLQLVKGKSYYLIQCFPPRERQAAEDAAAFMIQNGVPSGIQQRRSDIVLWATEAFDVNADDAAIRRAAQQRAKKLEARVKELGDIYFKQNGKYRFRDGSLRSPG